MDLQVVQAYLFGDVKYIDLLALAMLIDILTGIGRACKEKRLRSRTALFGYFRKIGVFGIIIAANIIDIILNLNGAVAMATVLFYICNEILSIVENCAQLGLNIPSVIVDKLQVIKEKDDEK
ncbi:phage holin family protein [Peribacillus simplex]|uniref:phage holin family protein n=1 Tax=Peribacillus simplex TaxID=1478 RepID=UPI003D2D25CE